MMQAGNLNHRVTITKPGPSSSYSSDPGPPVTVCRVWAQKKGLAGRSFYQAAQSQAEAEITYRIRHRVGMKYAVSAGMSVVEGTHTYDIYTPPVDEDGDRQWLTLHCKEVTPSG